MKHEHTHVDSQGFIHKCYHKCRNTLADAAFWIGVTISFPLEHFLWEKVWPFYKLSSWLGL